MKSILSGLRHRLAGTASLHTYEGLQQAEDFFHGPSIDWTPGSQKVVVLAPHMDDEVIGCGGTIARHADAGADVSVIYLTDGRRGAANVNRLRGAELRAAETELVARRKQEAQRALAVLGIRKLRFLDCEDTKLERDITVASRLRSALLELRPDIVYLPFFLEHHPDHRAVSPALIAATEGTDLSFQCHGFEVWTPLFPNCAVWIDSTMERKREAMAQYVSQLEDDNDLMHAMIGLASYRSVVRSKAQGRFAEAFCVLPLDQYARAYRSFAAGKSGRLLGGGVSITQEAARSPHGDECAIT
jgi:N-acetylglucosamine malate deacetylase 1